MGEIAAVFLVGFGILLVIAIWLDYGRRKIADCACGGDIVTKRRGGSGRTYCEQCRHGYPSSVWRWTECELQEAYEARPAAIRPLPPVPAQEG